MTPNINPNPRPLTKAINIDPNTGAPKAPVANAQPQRKDIANWLAKTGGGH